jgi:hypothetical protein
MGDRPDFDRTDRPRTAQPPPIRRPGALVVHEVFAAHLMAEGYSELADDLSERGAYGARKYATVDGPTPLTVDNGRDPLADAYEEFLDAVAYLAQETMRMRERMHRRDDDAPNALLWQAVVLAEQVRVALANR